MSRTRSGRVEEIFLLAIDRDPAEWRALLDQQCAGDKELRTEVETLLKCHADTDDFMDSKAAPGRGLMTQIGVAASGDEELKLPPDGMIGRYKVIERLGSGGMGIVYLAEQDRPKRTVALKVLRMGQASARMLRRFEYEAEVLGRLHHPGIAQVYEAGAWTHEGVTRPFIAMELVRGHAIGRHCEERHLGVRERLELIARVCDAVQHAHQAGVIHRDLKPGNIMIGEDGQAKLLDFGVARPLRNDLQLTTSMTGLGALIGTLPYMSPEQVLGDPNAIDTRSDVYAIGVILYELLSGRLPYDIRSRSLPEAARIIRDDEPAKLSGIDRVFRGEIETIVGQALEKDPARRYQSAAELGDDLRRFLEGLPIHARNSSRWYVVQKQLQRHRGWVAAGSAALLGLVAFAVYASVQAQNERDARLEAQGNLKEAERQKKIARETSDRLTSELRVSTIENARLRSRTGDLAAAEQLLWQQHLKNPESLHTFWGLWEIYHDHSMIMATRAHEPGVITHALSSDGATVATGGLEGVVRLWRASDMTLLKEISGHAAGTRVTSLQFDPAAAWIVSSGEDKQVIVHDAKSGETVGVYSARSPIRKITTSHDGKRAAVVEDSGYATVLALPEAKLISEFKLPSPAPCVEWDLDDSRLAFGGDDGAVRVTRPTGEPLATLTGHRDANGNSVRAVAFDPSSGRLATTGRDRTIRTYPPDLSQQTGIVASPNGAISAMSFTRDGTHLVSGGWWRLETLDLTTMKFDRAYTAPTSITSLTLSPDNRYAICGLGNGEIRVWELSQGGRHLLPGNQGRVVGSYSRDGRLVATGDAAGTVRLWDAASMRRVAEWKAHLARVKSLVFLPEGDPRPWLITTGEDRAVRIWNLETGELIRQAPGMLDESCAAVTLSPDGKLIVYAEVGGALMVRDLSTWAQVASLPKHGYGYIAPRFSADGSTLYASNRDRGLYGFSLPGFTPIPGPAPEPTTQPWAIATSTRGDSVAVSTWARVIQLRDPKTLKVVGTLDGHTGLVSCVEYSPADPRLLLSTCSDGTLRLWDTSEMRNVLLLKLGDANVEGISARFSPDGKAIVVCGSVGTAMVIDLAYYERAIANHTSIVLDREGLSHTTDDPKIQGLREWAARVRSQPWPRLGPYSTPTAEQTAYTARLEKVWSARPPTPLTPPK